MRAIAESTTLAGRPVRCAVVKDEQSGAIHRLICLTGIGEAFGRADHTATFDGGSAPPQMPRFLTAANVKPYVSDQLTILHKSPIPYTPMGGGVAYGQPVEVIPLTATTIIKAHAAGVLRSTQMDLLDNAIALQEAAAIKGWRDLVDESTGYNPAQQKPPLEQDDPLSKFLPTLETLRPHKDRLELVLYLIAEQRGHLMEMIAAARTDRGSRSKAGILFNDQLIHLCGQGDKIVQALLTIDTEQRDLAHDIRAGMEEIFVELTDARQDRTQLRAGQEAMAGQLRALLEGRPQQRPTRPRPQILEVDPRSYLLRAKTVPGALAHVQALPLDALRAAREHTEAGEVLAHLRAAEKSLSDGRVSAAAGRLGRALSAAKSIGAGDDVRVPVDLIDEARRLVVARLRYTYSAHGSSGRRKWLTLGLDNVAAFTPAAEGPIWFELLNDAGEIVAGPLFVDPGHAEAQEELTPIHADEHLRRYNAYQKAKNRMRRGIAPLVKAAPRRPKEAN